MTYDSARGVVVLFGGCYYYYDPLGMPMVGWYGDTWEWDGTEWKEIEDLSFRPSSRDSHAMTYDSARGVSVLFGGSLYCCGETWEY